MKVRGSDDKDESKWRWSLCQEVMRSMSGSDDKGGGDDEGENKQRWLWIKVTMKKKSERKWQWRYWCTWWWKCGWKSTKSTLTLATNVSGWIKWRWRWIKVTLRLTTKESGISIDKNVNKAGDDVCVLSASGCVLSAFKFLWRWRWFVSYPAGSRFFWR